MRRQERRKSGSSGFVSSSVESKYLKEDVCIAPEGAESREGDEKLYVTPEGVEPREGGEMDEAKTLFCLETGERIPSDAYSRRGHYITCCWGNCSTQSSNEDRSEDQEKQANTDISQCCDEAKCTCADGQSTDEFSGDERQSQFPFVNDKFYNSDGDSDDGETDCESDKECSDKSAVEQEARFGAEEAYAAKGEDTESLTVSAVRLPPRGACQHSNCGDDTHQSALNYTRAFMEWLGQLTTSKSREGETNTMARTHANDISEAYNAMDRALFDDEARAPGAEEAVTMKSYAELERQLLGMPRRGDVLVDSGSNIHFLTLDDAKRYFRSRRSTNMTVLGISGVREKCNAEGEIEMLVRDHLGKQLHLSLGSRNGLHLEEHPEVVAVGIQDNGWRRHTAL